MFEFNFKDISIEAKVKIRHYDYRASGYYRSHVFRNVIVNVNFWDFMICNDLYELATVKSTLNYFMQAYWKRSSNQENRINLDTSIEHNPNNEDGTWQKLNLSARKKARINYLEVSLTNVFETKIPMYLSGQEVIMLDIAISKVINLLSPQEIEPV
jgi:hypothetical protein